MVIAVTRGGSGRPYLFATVKMADAHPLVQYGDPIMCGSSDLQACLLPEECCRIAELAGDSRLSSLLSSVSISEFRRSRHLPEELWKLLERVAAPPSTDHTAVFREIVADRVATRRLGVVVRPRGVDSMSKHEHEKTPLEEAIEKTQTDPAHTATTDPALAEGVKEAEAAPPVQTGEDQGQKKVRVPPPREPKYADTCTIALLKDKEGVQFGKDHNPKKPGSASHDRFSRYSDGMTVGDATALGVLRGDLDNDVKKGYIQIHV